MNVLGIRKALERIRSEREEYITQLEESVASVGLRACDEWDEVCSFDPDDYDVDYLAGIKRGLMSDLRVIADILREAGVEVEG